MGWIERRRKTPNIQSDVQEHLDEAASFFDKKKAAHIRAAKNMTECVEIVWKIMFSPTVKTSQFDEK